MLYAIILMHRAYMFTDEKHSRCSTFKLRIVDKSLEFCDKWTVGSLTTEVRLMSHRKMRILLIPFILSS